MKEDFKIGINDQRAINKLGLETFHLDAEFEFDYSIDKLISELKDENNRLRKEHDALERMEDEEPELYAVQKEEAERKEISLDLQRYEYIESIYFNYDQLSALAEMKIIYAYRLFEIRLKKLIKASYSKNTRSFFKWENVVGFLKEKTINIKDLDRYNDIIELKDVNNALKHSDEMPKELMSIPEFTGKDNISFEELDKFYDRVRSAPKAFIESLAQAIYAELYHFDEKKLDQLSESLALRMEKDIATLFITKLSHNYR